jgi:hypothetical protein
LTLSSTSSADALANGLFHTSADPLVVNANLITANIGYIHSNGGGVTINGQVTPGNLVTGHNTTSINVDGTGNVTFNGPFISANHFGRRDDRLQSIDSRRQRHYTVASGTIRSKTTVPLTNAYALLSSGIDIVTTVDVNIPATGTGVNTGVFAFEDLPVAGSSASYFGLRGFEGLIAIEQRRGR